MGVKSQPRALLAKLSGVRLTEMKDCEQCCGFGGTFSVKYGDISGAIVDEKCRNVRASGADVLVLGDLGCILNIEGRLRRTGDTTTRVLHIRRCWRETPDADAVDALPVPSGADPVASFPSVVRTRFALVRLHSAYTNRSG